MGFKGPAGTLFVVFAVSVLFTIALLFAARSLHEKWGDAWDNPAFTRFALAIDFFDCMLDWVAVGGTYMEGDLEFANDENSIMFKALIGIAGICTFLFVLEAIILWKTKKLNKYVFVMHLGLEDVSQILIYSMVMKVNSNNAGFGSLLGVAQCVLFTVAKCVELFYGNMIHGSGGSADFARHGSIGRLRSAIFDPRAKVNAMPVPIGYPVADRV